MNLHEGKDKEIKKGLGLNACHTTTEINLRGYGK